MNEGRMRLEHLRGDPSVAVDGWYGWGALKDSSQPG